MASKPWQDIAKEAQELRDKSIAEVHPTLPDINIEDLPLNVTSIPSQYLTPSEIDITETSPEKLVNLLAAGKLSCAEVTNAFLRRSGIAQKVVRLYTYHTLSAVLR
jgi:amidase